MPIQSGVYFAERSGKNPANAAEAADMLAEDATKAGQTRSILYAGAEMSAKPGETGSSVMLYWSMEKTKKRDAAWAEQHLLELAALRHRAEAAEAEVARLVSIIGAAERLLS